MLKLLRSGAQTWVAKIFFVVLVGSFGVWGISRSLVGSTPDAVVTVGDQKVGTREFRLTYERQLALASRQFGRRLTAEQARAFGLEQQVLSQLAAGAALDELSQKMKLGLSQKRLAEQIAAEPAFRAPNGQFDRQIFRATLRNAGLREEDYINSQSKAAVRSQIIDAVADGFQAPKTLINAMTEYRKQTRDIRYMLISSSNIDPVKAPSEDELKKWYEQKKANYRAPEYRKFAYLKLEPSDIIDPSSVSEDDVKADYEKNKDHYRVPGSRTIEQLSFESKDKADAAEAKLKSGEATFDQLVTDSGRKLSDVMLGNFTEDKVPDPKIAKAAFDIKADGGTSPVVKGSFGPVILRATEIKPEGDKSYGEVKDQIRHELALSKAADQVLNIHDKYEDLRASGATLEEAAKQLNLKAVEVKDIDAEGKDMKGDAVKNIPEEKKLLSAVFNTDEGVDSLAVDIGTTGYIWFDVQSITPAHDRKLSEVHDKVVADWTQEKTKDAVAAKAAEQVKKIKDGAKIDDLASSLGVAVEEKTGLKRNSEDAVLGSQAISTAFDGPKGYAASARTADNSEQIVLVVSNTGTDDTVDALSNDSKQIKTLANAAGDDILDQMVAKLQTAYGVSINPKLAEQIMAR